jgi:hypothetical protein
VDIMPTDALLAARRRANVPNPLGAAIPLLALAGLALLLDAAPDLPWQVGIGVAALFAAAALARFAQHRLTVRQLRRVADQLILRAGTRAGASPLVAWRTLELTSEQHRRLVAREAARLARELDAATLPGAVPLNRAAARCHRPELEALAEHLEGEPAVDARGVLLVEQLLSSPSSPLYDRQAAADLGVQLRRATAALRTAR